MARSKKLTDVDTDVDLDNLQQAPQVLPQLDTANMSSVEDAVGTASDDVVNTNNKEEQDVVERNNAQGVPVSPEAQPSNAWQWIGSPSRPEARAESDGISDLFRVSSADVGASKSDLGDLTNVDIARDILDAGDDGTLDDLLTVTNEDIMGDDLYGQRPAKSASKQRQARRRIVPVFNPLPNMRQMR